MKTTRSPYPIIRASYLSVFDSSKTVEDQKLAARNVVQTIVEKVFFKNTDVVNHYIAVNNSLVEAGKKPYVDSFSNKLRFLCDKGYINNSFKSEYEFISKESGEHSAAHVMFAKGEPRLLMVIKVYLNEILNNFLDEFEESKDYIIPMEVIAETDRKFHGRVVNRIDSFLNIKEGEVWYIKYRTVISYLLIFLSTILFSIVLALGLIIIGIYLTRILVFEKRVKLQRNLFHFSFMGLIVINVLLNNFELIKNYNNSKARFDPNSIPETNKSISITQYGDSVPKNILDFEKLKKDESIQIVTQHTYRNIGYSNMTFPKAELNIIRKSDHIVFEGKLISGDDELIDSVFVTNINEPYRIEFLEGLIMSPRDKCKGYGYTKILYSQYFTKYKSAIGGFDKGIYFSNYLDSYQDGYCSSGSIYAVFEITKL